MLNLCLQKLKISTAVPIIQTTFVPATEKLAAVLNLQTINLCCMLKLSKFCAWTARKLAQMVEKLAPAASHASRFLHLWFWYLVANGYNSTDDHKHIKWQKCNLLKLNVQVLRMDWELWRLSLPLKSDPCHPSPRAKKEGRRAGKT